MTGKLYYLTTLADWQRYAHRFANSHWLALDSADAMRSGVAPLAQSPPRRIEGNPAATLSVEDVGEGFAVVACRAAERQIPRPDQTPIGTRNDAIGGAQPEGATRILALVEADEGVHLALEDDAAFEPLPHPLAQKPISDPAQLALAPHGVASGATTFDVAKALARVHPLLRHRVF